MVGDDDLEYHVSQCDCDVDKAIVDYSYEIELLEESDDKQVHQQKYQQKTRKYQIRLFQL